MFHILRQRLARLEQRYRADQRGAMAIEFAMVVMPFVTLLFGTIAVGMYYFVTFSLENAVEQAARQIRTGQAQLANMTKNQFKSNVCGKAPGFIDCTNYLRVNVIEYTDFASVASPTCLDQQGKLINDPADDPVPGDAGNVVLVIVCYEWKLAGMLPFLKLGSMNNGSSLIQAATTFRTEPFS